MSTTPAPASPAQHPEAALMIVDAASAGQQITGAGFHQEDPRALHLRVDDLGVTRGDGVFETIGVFNARPVQLEAHLRRLRNSATLLELGEPRLDVWRDAVVAAVEAAGAAELSVKAVLTRGVEGSGLPTGWVLAFPAPDATQARAGGVSVVTLSRGYSSDIARTAPWLLQGAKTTSYALNMAAVREARRRGAEDVIFTSTDSYVLEGPTSTVVLRHRGELVTPGTDQGILAGTTQELLFAFAADRGIPAVARPVPVSELERAEHVWLCSSVRLCAPVRTIDGRPLPVDSELAQEFLAYARQER